MKKVKKTGSSSKVPLNPSIFKQWAPDAWRHNEVFHVEKIESYKDNLKLPLQPHRRTVYFFMLVTKGKVIRSKGLTNYEILPGHCFFLPAYQITSLEHISADAEGYYCHFLPDIFNQRWIKKAPMIDFPFFQLIGNPVVQIKNSERIIPLLKTLENEYQKNEKKQLGLIALYLLTLLSEVELQLEPVKEQKNNAAAILTQRYKNALSELIHEKKTIFEFAEHLSVTANHLNKCVKSITGQSAHQLFDEMRLLEAKVLLQQTELSIGEIAFKIGQFDPSDFSRLFKSKMNMTPQQYRQNR